MVGIFSRNKLYSKNSKIYSQRAEFPPSIDFIDERKLFLSPGDYQEAYMRYSFFYTFFELPQLSPTITQRFPLSLRAST